ncbi:MAG TPA: flavin reductase family protein [bacterium]|nr:flavin reductase family protein [bacterium]
MNEDAKKKLLQMAPHALYVLTSQTPFDQVASTVSWLTQASFEPPLIMTAIRRDTDTYHVVHQSRAFVVNVLGKDQAAVAQKFFKHAELKGEELSGERFERTKVLGFAYFPHLAGYLECRVTDEVDRGDHTVIVAQVVEAELLGAEGPLLLSSTKWQYGG